MQAWEAFVAPLLTLLLAIVSPVLAWWGSTRYFNGRFEEWRKASDEWRKRMEDKLERFDIAGTLRATLDENVKLRLQTLEREVTALRRWKHTKGERYVGALDAVNSRIHKLEESAQHGQC